MKNWILWSFSRGSFQYDVLCGLILVTIFAIPRGVFHDRPEYMRVPQDGDVQRSVDANENLVYTVKVNGNDSIGAQRQQALEKLQRYLALDELPETYRMQAVPNARGSVEALALWIK